MAMHERYELHNTNREARGKIILALQTIRLSSRCVKGGGGYFSVSNNTTRLASRRAVIHGTEAGISIDAAHNSGRRGEIHGAN
jgi:hypothetical protein